MDSPVSPNVEQEKLTSQKTKKKPKNKRSSGKGAANKVSGDEMVSENGLSAKLEQHLHITLDGLQYNGNKESCNSHTVQNGHHSPTNDTAINMRKSNFHAQQKQYSKEATVSGSLKKSKSKNKQSCKEANTEYENNATQLKSYSGNSDSSSPIVLKQTEVMNNTTEIAMVGIKNGFHNCVHERNNDLQIKVSPQQYLSNESKTILEEIDATSRALVDPKTVPILESCLQQNPLATTTAANANCLNAYSITSIPKLNNTAKQNSEETHQAKQNIVNPSMERSMATENEINLTDVHIEYKEYESELQMHDIMRLIQAELSEPYSIYTYRYFIYNWPKLCFLAAHGNEYVGAIVCKLDMHMNVRRGYIAMLAVRKEYRKLKIGTTLVQKAIEAMLADNADEVVLETEMRNVPALRLYENLGFVRDKRLFRYYLNGVDALRLKLWFR